MSEKRRRTARFLALSRLVVTARQDALNVSDEGLVAEWDTDAELVRQALRALASELEKRAARARP